VLRAIWLTLKFLLSALVGSLAVAMLLFPGAKATGATLAAGAFFAFLAALPWLNWGSSISPLGVAQSPKGPGPVMSTVIAIALIVIGGLVLAYSAVELRHLGFVLRSDREMPRIVTLTHDPIEFVLRSLFGLSLGAAILLLGFVALFKALPRLGISPRGPLRAFATPDVPKLVMYALYAFLGVWFVLLHFLPMYYGRGA